MEFGRRCGSRGYRVCDLGDWSLRGVSAMTKDDIIRMAREAGLFTHKEVQPELERFANLVAAHKAEVALAEAYRCGYKDGMNAAAWISENLSMQQEVDVHDDVPHPVDMDFGDEDKPQ